MGSVAESGLMQRPRKSPGGQGSLPGFKSQRFRQSSENIPEVHQGRLPSALFRVANSVGRVPARHAGSRWFEPSATHHTHPGNWGHSSDGRAPAWHAGGREFDSPWLHHWTNPQGSIPPRFQRGAGWRHLAPGCFHMNTPGPHAGIAQMVEQSLRKRWVVGSSPSAGSIPD